MNFFPLFQDCIRVCAAILILAGFAVSNSDLFVIALPPSFTMKSISRTIFSFIKRKRIREMEREGEDSVSPVSGLKILFDTQPYPMFGINVSIKPEDKTYMATKPIIKRHLLSLHLLP